MVTLRLFGNPALTGPTGPLAGRVTQRHLLADSLYVVRKALGEEAVLAAGDQLRLNPAAVQADVCEFEAALARGELDRALTCYAGPFLA